MCAGSDFTGTTSIGAWIISTDSGPDAGIASYYTNADYLSDW